LQDGNAKGNIMRVVQPLKKQSFASYKIGEQKAARAAGQDRPDRAKLLQQYKSMNAAPVRDIGTGDPVFRPKDIASTTQSPNNPGPRGGVDPRMVRNAGDNDYARTLGGPSTGPAVNRQIPQEMIEANKRAAALTAREKPTNYGSPENMLNMMKSRQGGGDYNAGVGAMGGGTPAGTLSPRGAVTGGARPAPPMGGGMKKGGSVRAEKMASGGMTSKAPAASKRGDGIAQRGKTKGRMV
jgi:hypothetical protein